MGHKQSSFLNSKGRYQLSHGGELRKKRNGRGQRPLSCKEPLHAVFKINKQRLRHRSLRSARGFQLTHHIIQRYARRFYVKVEHLSIQNDHIHILIRTSRRSQFHYFFRVVAGQIAQVFEKEGLFAVTKNVTGTPAVGGKGLWKYRPFSRVVRGWRAYKIVRDYIQLNEKEVLGIIPYRALRLKGLSIGELELLWT